MRRAAIAVVALALLFGAVMATQSTAFVQGWMPLLGLVVYGGLLACAIVIGVARVRGTPGSSVLAAGSLGGSVAMIVGLALEQSWVVTAAVAAQAATALAHLARPRRDDG